MAEAKSRRDTTSPRPRTRARADMMAPTNGDERPLEQPTTFGAGLTDDLPEEAPRPDVQAPVEEAPAPAPAPAVATAAAPPVQRPEATPPAPPPHRPEGTPRERYRQSSP